MMNPSDFLTSMKMDLGLYGLTLPFDDPDKVMMDVIKLKTLPIFSVFVPHVFQFETNLRDLTMIKNTYEESIYELPPAFGDRRIVYVRKITPRNKSLSNGMVSPVFGSGYDLAQSLMAGQASADLYSYASPPFTWKFENPNRIKIYNMNSLATELIIEVALEHSDNLSTINNTAWVSFTELALLDLKRFFYGALKHYKDMQTAYGTISLKIDDWENAENERKDLIAQWKQVYHLDTDVLVVI